MKVYYTKEEKENDVSYYASSNCRNEVMIEYLCEQLKKFYQSKNYIHDTIVHAIHQTLQTLQYDIQKNKASIREIQNTELTQQ